jgi:CDP-alcohol phosphatidyltransferase
VPAAVREEARKVWFFVPNLIGYARIATAAVAFAEHAQGHATAFFWWYGVSYALDAVDGVAARSLNQGAWVLEGWEVVVGVGVECEVLGVQRLSLERCWTW